MLLQAILQRQFAVMAVDAALLFEELLAARAAGVGEARDEVLRLGQ